MHTYIHTYTCTLHILHTHKTHTHAHSYTHAHPTCMYVCVATRFYASSPSYSPRGSRQRHKSRTHYCVPGRRESACARNGPATRHSPAGDRSWSLTVISSRKGRCSPTEHGQGPARSFEHDPRGSLFQGLPQPHTFSSYPNGPLS